MKKTTLDEFRKEVLSTGKYATPPERLAPKRAKNGAWTTLRFSLGVSRVFPLCALCEPFGLLNTDRWARFCFSTVQIAEALGMKVVLEGWENRKKISGPVMYLCNHMSTVETILLPPVLLGYGPFCTVVKASLSHLPFLEKAAAHMGLIPVGRVSPREDLVNTMRVGIERMQAGSSMLIFPQGSREKVFSRKMYSSIGAKIAEKAGVPIVPLVVDTRCQPTREKGMLSKIFKDFGTVDTRYDIRLACCEPIMPAKAKIMHEAAFDVMATKLESWGLPTER